MTTHQYQYEVDARTCIRCAACATVAPGLFALDGPAARALRSPIDDVERRACAAALLLCPTTAIHRREATDGA
jgi:ferredoxin